MIVPPDRMRTTIVAKQTLLDALGEQFPDSSKTTLRQMLQGGRVRINGEIEKNARFELEPGSLLEVVPRSVQVVLPPELALLHEDDDVIVVLKAHGLLTVATEREKMATAQAYLNQYLKEKRQGRIHVVHRLDRETSGVLLFAKNLEAREKLKEMFAAHTVERLYVAIIEGTMNPPAGTIRSNLLEGKDLRMTSVPFHRDAKLAVTHYRTIEITARYSMLDVTLETGRKNQIRAHLSEAGHPIVGDQLYGSVVNPIQRLGLHAKVLGFEHPTTGKHLKFIAPIPRAFRDLLKL